MMFRFTGTEHDWLTKILKKRVHLAKQPEFQKKNERLAKLVIGLSKKLSGDQEPNLNRNDLRFLEELVDNHITFAVTTVISELGKRIDKGNERKSLYEKTLVEVEQKVVMLEGLRDRIKEKL